VNDKVKNTDSIILHLHHLAVLFSLTVTVTEMAK